jgi:predicted small metal-binding protein
MKQFECSKLGNNCNVVLTAPTEERLVEMASLHLREVHEMASIPQDLIGRIKQNMVSRSMSDAAYVVDGIFEKYNCSSDPDCTWRYIAEAEIILTGSVRPHMNELKAA